MICVREIPEPCFSDARRRVGPLAAAPGRPRQAPGPPQAIVTIGSSGRIVISSGECFPADSTAAHCGLPAFPNHAGGTRFNRHTIPQVKVVPAT